MAAVNVRGKILYMPGPWGMARPAAGVSFTIVDRDLGNAEDTIFNGLCNASGDFAGTTSDWRDTRSVTVNTLVGSYSTDVADVSDVMALWLEVRQQIGNRSYSISLPYVPPLPGLPVPILVLPWAPPGRTQIRIDGVAKRTLNDCSQAIQSLFGTGAAVASHGVRHEIALFGEQVGQLRQQLTALNGAIESVLLAIDTQRAKERTSAGAGALAARLHGASQVRTSLAAVAGKAVNIGQAVGIRTPGPDPWEAIRQRIVALVQSTEQVARNAAAQCGVNGAALTMLTKIVVTLVSIVIAVVVATFTFGSFAAGGAPVVALAVVAIASAVVTVVANMPALLNAVAAMLDGCGMADAASAVRGTSGDVGAWMDSNHWFGSCVLLIAMACAVLILMLSAPADGWTWLVEIVNGSDGVPGMRFVFTR